jgi:signal transduction histidine kinase
MRDLNILVDRSQLIEVMRNLITNSCESIGPKRGTILLTAYQKGRWGVIAIEDNGGGISKANLRKIFNPYYSTKPSTKNWGLGLSYCQQIIQMMDGDILVKSEEGKGSTFSIYLSLAER